MNIQKLEQYESMLGESETNQLAKPTAGELSPFVRSGSYVYDLTREFRLAMGQPCPDHIVLNPTVSERILLGMLILEEALETVTKGLGLRLAIKEGEDIYDYANIPVDLLELIHHEGDFYNPVETLDGIADVGVVINWAGLALGLPVDDANFEVFASNMTKLDSEGKPIHNVCADSLCKLARESNNLGDCEEQSHLIDPTRPAGKILKPVTYTPANIAALLHSRIIKERN